MGRHVGHHMGRHVGHHIGRHKHSKNELKTALASPGTEINVFLYLATPYL